MYPLHGAVWTDAASIDQGLNAPRREEVSYPAGLVANVRLPIPDRPGGGWTGKRRRQPESTPQKNTEGAHIAPRRACSDGTVSSRSLTRGAGHRNCQPLG